MKPEARIALLKTVGLLMTKKRYGYAITPALSKAGAFKLTLEPRRALSGEVAYWQIGHELCLLSRAVRIPIGSALSKDEAIVVALRFVKYLGGQLKLEDVLRLAA